MAADSALKYLTLFSLCKNKINTILVERPLHFKLIQSKCHR